MKKVSTEQPVVSVVGHTESDPLDETIWLIGRAYFSYVRLLERLLAKTGLDEHLRPGMGHILFSLYEKDERSIKEIAERSQLSYSTLSGLLKRMERAKIITRRSDEEDGRVVRVCLTALGRGLEPRCREVLQTLSNILRSGMGTKNVRQVKRLLQRMNKTFRAEEHKLRMKQT